MVDDINAVYVLQLEYYEIVDAATLQAVDQWEGHCVGCVTVYCGDVRLIDNIRYC